MTTLITIVAIILIVVGLLWMWRTFYGLLIYNVVDVDVGGLKALLRWGNLVYFTLPLLTLIVGIGLLWWF